MPTIFTHGAIGYTAVKPYLKNPFNDRLIMASIILSVLPDVDGLFYTTIPYGHLFGHRGLTHSLLFAVVAGLATALIFLQTKWRDEHSFGALALFFTMVTASHGFFDAMTNGGLGVAFLAPFDNTRYFFPFRPIPVSPMTVRGLLSERGLYVMQVELGLFWTFAIAAALWDRRNLRRIAGACVVAAVGVVSWYYALTRL